MRPEITLHSEAGYIFAGSSRRNRFFLQFGGGPYIYRQPSLPFAVLDGRCRLLQEREGPPMTVTVEIDSSWVKFVRSPAFTVVSALSGVSVSFAPYFLYLSGQGRFYHGSEWLIVP